MNPRVTTMRPSIYDRQLKATRIWAAIALLAVVSLVATYVYASTEVHALKHQNEVLRSKFEALSAVVSP